MSKNEEQLRSELALLSEETRNRYSDKYEGRGGSRKSRSWVRTAYGEPSEQRATGPRQRTLNVKQWKRAQVENLVPLKLRIFRTKGGSTALKMLHAWALVLLERRETGDASAIPQADGKKSIGGFSLPELALHAQDVNRYLEAQPAYVRKLLEFIFVDGWEMQCNEIAYLVRASACDEKEAGAWGRLMTELAEYGDLDDPDTKRVIDQAEREMHRLAAQSVIVLGEGEEAPVQATASMANLRRRWTFDLERFRYTSELFEMAPAARELTLTMEIRSIVDNMAAELGLGETFGFIPAAKWDEGEG